MCGGISGIRGNVIESQKLSWPTPLTWQGTWVVDVTYLPGDVVRKHNGVQWVYYISRDKNTTNPRTDIFSHWWELSDTDRPLIMWHQFAPGEIHPDDPDVPNVWNVSINGATSGTYDIDFAMADDPTIHTTITVDASSTDFGALEAQIDTALSGPMQYEGSTDAYSITFVDLWLGEQFVVTISNDTTDGGGAFANVATDAVPSGIDAPLASVLHGQGFALTDGYLYVKTGTGPNDWVEIPELTQDPTSTAEVVIGQSGTALTLDATTLMQPWRGSFGAGKSRDFWTSIVVTAGDAAGAGSVIEIDLSPITEGPLFDQSPINWKGTIGGETAYGIVVPSDGVLLDMLGNPVTVGLTTGDAVYLNGTLWLPPF